MDTLTRRRRRRRLATLFEDWFVWEDLQQVAVGRHLPAAVHLLERLGVAAVLGVSRGRRAPALRGSLEELRAAEGHA